MKMKLKDFFLLSLYEQRHIQNKIVALCRAYLVTSSINVAMKRTYRTLDYSENIIRHCIKNDKGFKNEIKEKHTEKTSFRRKTIISNAP